jgi:hypothetical protein
MLSSVEKLLAIEEIRTLKARYFRFVDSHDWKGLRSILADDAVFASLDPSHSEASGTRSGVGPAAADIDGGDEIVAWASAGLADAHSVHFGFMPEIEILSPDTARGIWGMEDIVRWPGRVLHGHGYYCETYVRRRGAWLIKSVRLVRKSLKIDDLATSDARIARHAE